MKKTVIVSLFILSILNIKYVFAGIPEPTSQPGTGTISQALNDSTKEGIFTEDKELSLNGSWKSKGYGYLFTALNGNFKLYDYTKVSMIKIAEGKIDNNRIELEGLGSMMIYRLGEDSLGVQLPSGKNIYFTRMDSLPAACITETAKDPVSVFEVFWNTFEENCILFQLTSTDWKALYTKYRPLVNNNTTDEELFKMFCTMLEPLKDSHTNLIDPFNMKSYSPGPKDYEWWSSNKDKIVSVVASYLDEKKIGAAGTGHVLYGMINKEFGYLNIDQFAEYLEGASFNDDAAFYKEVIDSIIVQCRNTKALIVDIRSNRGGYDDFALELASRFNTGDRISHYKQVRTGGYSDFSEPIPIGLSSSSINYTGKPVILLTSRFTVSAADVCAMAFRELPNVTIIGENTRGMFSDMQGKTLPNGWAVTLSNEKYTTSDGKFLEHIGITPDIYVKADSSSFNTGRDLILEKAIETLNKLTKVENERINNLNYELEQNYPNPFNPSTTIRYQVPQRGIVNLKVYDMLGKEITDLVNSYKDAGSYSVVFNGASLASGVYIYKLIFNPQVSNEHFIKSAKMMLVK